MTKQSHIKLNDKLNKNVSLAFFLLFFSAGFGWYIKPVFFYKQKEGTVVNIKESQEYYSKGRYTSGYIYFDIYIFNVDGKEISLTKNKNKKYDYLIGKTIKYRSFHRYNPRYFGNENFAEIAYNNQVIYSTNENVKWFIFILIVFILSLFWCIWFFVSKWQNAPPIKKKSNNDEEAFFDNWSVRKKNDKCTLSYISKLDGTVKHIKISSDDYESAKNGNMNLNDFSKKYNLW